MSSGKCKTINLIFLTDFETVLENAAMMTIISNGYFTADNNSVYPISVSIDGFYFKSR